MVWPHSWFVSQSSSAEDLKQTGQIYTLVELAFSASDTPGNPSIFCTSTSYFIACLISCVCHLTVLSLRILFYHQYTPFITVPVHGTTADEVLGCHHLDVLWAVFSLQSSILYLPLHFWIRWLRMINHNDWWIIFHITSEYRHVQPVCIYTAGEHHLI